MPQARGKPLPMVRNPHLRAPIIQTLRTSIEDADERYRVARNGEEKRTAILMALGTVLSFHNSLMPPIISLALGRHFESVADLVVGQPDATLKKSPGHGLTVTADQRVRDAYIAAAFRMLTEGGARRGSISRNEAGRFVAGELNKAGARDRGARFTEKRVLNIHLETTRRTKAKAPDKKPSSSAEAVVAVARQRARGLHRTLYADIMKHVEILKTVKAIRNFDDRKRLAVEFVRRATEFAPPPAG